MRAHELYEPIGIIDDDRHKVGQRIHGVRVLGPVDDLPEIIKRSDPNEIVIAIPSAKPYRCLTSIITFDIFCVLISIRTLRIQHFEP